MTKRPCKLHYYRSVSGRRGADVFLSYPENESIREACEQPCRGGHGQRPVERREKSKDHDGSNKRKNKVPDALSSSMAKKRMSPSPTVLYVLGKQ